MNTPRAIIFDLDDTLYPERDYVASGYRAVAAAIVGGAHVPTYAARNPQPATGDQAVPTPPLEDWLWQRFLAGQAANAFDAMNEHFALGLSKEGVAELVRIYRGHTPAIKPFAGMRELLGRLAKRHCLGLLSDGYLPAQRLKLGALGLTTFFKRIVFTEEIGRDAWKPSPVGFELMTRRLAMPHTDCVYVADNPRKDFLAPNQFGWGTVQFLQEGQIHSTNPAPEGGKPQTVARSIDELELLLM